MVFPMAKPPNTPRNSPHPRNSPGPRNSPRNSPRNDIRIVNRRALHEYHILEKLETGIVLTGSEVKSIRAGQVSLAEGFAQMDEKNQGLALYQVDIALYPHAGPFNHEPRRPRRLLAHKREIARLQAVLSAKGATLVPLALYFVRGRCKVELGAGVGKHAFDKRQDLKTREAERAMRRGMTRKTL